MLYGPPKGAPQEASFRASCGRAYYGAYAHARDVLTTAGFLLPKDHSGHQVVVSLLKRSGDANVKTAGSLLETLRIERNEADYDVGKQVRRPFQQKQSQIAVVRSHSIVTSVDEAAKKHKKLFIP